MSLDYIADQQQQSLFVTFRDEIVDWIVRHGITKAESKLLFYLAKLDRFGDRPVKLRVAQILLATGIGKSAYHLAVAKFQSLGWFDFQHDGVVISNKVTHAKYSEKPDNRSEKPESMSKISELKSEKTDSNSRKTDNRRSKASSRKGSGSPQTLQTKTDLIHTSSDGEEKQKKCVDEFEESRCVESLSENPTQDLSQERKILPETNIPPRQVEVITTAIEPFGRRGGLACAQDIANPYPPGEWMVGGKLDPQFVDWKAKQFVRDFGTSDMHKARRDARAMWLNAPAKLPLDWQQYHEEFVHRATNVAIQEQAGIDSPAIAEHKKLIASNSRAISNPVSGADYRQSQELVDLSQKQPAFGFQIESQSPTVSLPAEPDWDAISNQATQEERDYLADAPHVLQQEAVTPPFDEQGQTENGDAYKAYKPVEVEAAPPPKDLLGTISNLAQKREMNATLGERVGRNIKKTPQKSPLELLNEMLAEPLGILRRDPSVQRRAEQYAEDENYIVDRDENGLIFKIEEIGF